MHGHSRKPTKPTTLHVDVVRDALPRKGVSKIREAFRRLVHWPRVGTIDGIATADEAMALLHDISTALVRKHDTRVMPFETMALLQRVADDMGHRLAGGWYATGAVFVLDRLEWWRAGFDRSFQMEK